VTTPRKGDRVRVEYEATYLSTKSDGQHVVSYDMPDYSGWRALVRPDAKITVLPREYKVGDMIETQDDLDALPVGAVVDPGGMYALGVKVDDHRLQWNLTNGARAFYPRLPARYIAQRDAENT
jgi:hypothetical protein